MKAIYLVRKGDPSGAFETREVSVPQPGPGEILIRVEGFGLNFADVLARRGLYPDAPPMPCVLGYDVAGTIAEAGQGVDNFVPGDRVTAMTHFGGYAEYAIAPAFLTAKIGASTSVAEATALTVQYCTAFYAAAELVNLFPGDRVLIHASAGGVGTALLQWARYKGCEIFATAGSEDKLRMARESGATHVINYKTQDFAKVIQEITGGKGVDVIFDSIGGATTRKGMQLLAPGGRLVCYGAADISGRSFFGKMGALLAFGFYHPLGLMSPSKGILGINMLRIATNKPVIFKRTLDRVVQLYQEGIFKPVVGQEFPASKISEAHAFLESRRSIGKIALVWQE